MELSFIGYVKEELPVNNKTTIDITLEPGVKSFDGVVVTAIGMDRDKKKFGWLFQEVENEDLIRSKEPSKVTAMTAKVTIVQITGSSGAVTRSAQIRIKDSAYPRA